MNVQEAVDAWQAQYGGEPPVGFMLRFSHDGVWTRLDYLDESAEGHVSDAEQMASRFDAVASALFTGTTVLILAIEIDPDDHDMAILRNMGAEVITPPESWVRELATYMPDQPRVEYMAMTMSWRRGSLDPVWLAVALDLIGRVALFCPATGDAFLPCGSGVDLFVWGSDRRTKLRDRFREWIPNGRAQKASAELERQVAAHRS
jgi:hypothetical protein